MTPLPSSQMRVHTPNPGQPYLGGAVVNDGVYKRQGVLQGLGTHVFQSLIRDKRDNNGGHHDRDPPCPSTTLTPSTETSTVPASR